MPPLNRQRFPETQRMEVRSYDQLARAVIAQYWPMWTVIHHNPLPSLEGLHFDEAVKRGAHLFGGRGYLSNEIFRRYFKNGRVPYHQPLRLLAVIEAPRDRIRAIIDRQPLLEQSFGHGWVSLGAMEPQNGAFYRDNLNEWKRIQGESHDQLIATSHERN